MLTDVLNQMNLTDIQEYFTKVQKNTLSSWHPVEHSPMLTRFSNIKDDLMDRKI